LLIHFARHLAPWADGGSIELYGFDILGPGVQKQAFLDRTVERLAIGAPGVPWERRIAWIRPDEAWPYPEGFFHAVVSNQVLEHVRDHGHFFTQLFRTLAWGGFSAHLFPLKHCVYEGHVHLPFAHRIGDHELLQSYIATLSAIGLGKYRVHRRATGISLERSAERDADYLRRYTNYLTHREILRLAKRHGLRASFKYSREFYTQKLRAMCSLPQRQTYERRRSSMADWISVLGLRYLSSVTLFLEKVDAFRPPGVAGWQLGEKQSAPLKGHDSLAPAQASRPPGT